HWNDDRTLLVFAVGFADQIQLSRRDHAQHQTPRGEILPRGRLDVCRRQLCCTTYLLRVQRWVIRPALTLGERVRPRRAALQSRRRENCVRVLEPREVAIRVRRLTKY